MGLFYRADLFKKYGLTVPTTWAQYLSDAKKLHAANPNAYIAAFPANDAQWFSGLAWQAGAKWFSTSGDTWVTGIDDSPSVQVANFWQQLISDHLVKVEPDFASEWYKDLSDGTLLTWPTAVWGENTLITNAASTKGDWRVAAMPNWGIHARATATGAARRTVVFKDSKHPAQAAQFAEWLNTQPAEHHRPDHQGRPLPGRPGRPEAARRQLPGRVLRRPEHLAGLPGRRQAGEHAFQWGPIMSTTFTQMAGRLRQVDERLRHARPGADVDAVPDRQHDEVAGLLGEVRLRAWGSTISGRPARRRPGMRQAPPGRTRRAPRHRPGRRSAARPRPPGRLGAGHVPGTVRGAVRPVLPAADRVRGLREPPQGARLGPRPRSQLHHDGVRGPVQLHPGLLRPVVPAGRGPGAAVRRGPDPGDAALRHRPRAAAGLGGRPVPALLPAGLLPAVRHSRGDRRDPLVVPVPARPEPGRRRAARRRLRHGELPRRATRCSGPSRTSSPGSTRATTC